MNCEECRHYDYEQAAKLHGHPCEIHGIANPYGCKDGERKMEWYIYWHDSNAKKIIKWNIFEHGTFRKELDEMYKKYKTKEEFAKRLDGIMRYYFWSKSEHEVLLVNPWVGDGNSMKIDVCDQLHMNWDRFIDYVWSFKED